MAKHLFQKGHQHSKETKQKISLSHKGLTHTKETKEKLRKAIKGRKPMLGKHHSEETKRKLRLSRKKQIPPMLGKKHNKETRKKLSLSHIGKKQSSETIAKRVAKMSGELSHFWKGGITPINEMIRSSVEYKLWREAVFKRDKFQCIWGGKEHGSNLQADHIKPFSLYPELRFAIDNGRTLCKDCHKKTITYGGKARSYIPD